MAGSHRALAGHTPPPSAWPSAPDGNAKPQAYRLLPLPLFVVILVAESLVSAVPYPTHGTAHPTTATTNAAAVADPTVAVDRYIHSRYAGAYPRTVHCGCLGAERAEQPGAPGTIRQRTLFCAYQAAAASTPIPPSPPTTKPFPHPHVTYLGRTSPQHHPLNPRRAHRHTHNLHACIDHGSIPHTHITKMWKRGNGSQQARQRGSGGRRGAGRGSERMEGQGEGRGMAGSHVPGTAAHSLFIGRLNRQNPPPFFPSLHSPLPFQSPNLKKQKEEWK